MISVILREDTNHISCSWCTCSVFSCADQPSAVSNCCAIVCIMAAEPIHIRSVILCSIMVFTDVCKVRTSVNTVCISPVSLFSTINFQQTVSHFFIILGCSFELPGSRQRNRCILHNFLSTGSSLGECPLLGLAPFDNLIALNI